MSETKYTALHIYANFLCFVFFTSAHGIWKRNRSIPYCKDLLGVAGDNGGNTPASELASSMAWTKAKGKHGRIEKLNRYYFWKFGLVSFFLLSFSISLVKLRSFSIVGLSGLKSFLQIAVNGVFSDMFLLDSMKSGYDSDSVKLPGMVERSVSKK